MSIRDLEMGKNLKKIGYKMGREIIAMRALEIAKQILEVNSYKNAIAGIGRMVTLGKCCSGDCYWSEKRDRGKYREEIAIEMFDEKGKFPDKIIAVE